jgi:hypothetical protein
MRGEDQQAVTHKQGSEEVQERRPSIGTEVRKKRTNPDKIELLLDNNSSQINIRVDASCSEGAGTKIDTVRI